MQLTAEKGDGGRPHSLPDSLTRARWLASFNHWMDSAAQIPKDKNRGKPKRPSLKNSTH